MSDTPITIFGDLRTAEVTPIFQGSFEYTVDNTELSENTETNGGTVTQADAMAVCTSGTTTGAVAKLQSARHGQHRAGQGVILRFTALFSAPVAGCDQLIGLGDEPGSSVAYKNGLFVGYLNGQFGFHRFVNDTVDSVLQADWSNPLDGSGSGAGTLDPTKLNVFYIKFGYLGASDPELLWMNRSSKMIRAHRFRTAGTLITPHTYNPNYHFVIHAANLATTSNVVVKCASYGYFIEGKTEVWNIQHPQQSSGEVTKTTVTTEVPILSIRNKTTYAGKTNFIDVQILLMSASIEASAANNLATMRLIANGTLGGTPVWNDVNTTDSVVEIETAATSISGGKELMTGPLAGKNDRDLRNVENLKALLSHGNTITITGSSVNSATIKASILWQELF